MDLFDNLVKACKNVRTRLEQEQRALNVNATSLIIPQIPAGTAAAKLVGNITSLTKPGVVLAITRLSPEEEERLAILEKTLLDLQANDPKRLAAQLKIRADRLRALGEHLRVLEQVLSDAEVTAIFSIRTAGRSKSEEARRLREMTFPPNLLPGTGGEQWKAMWESSRLFSEQQAYPEKVFPVPEDESKCVLCQQDLDHDAAQRLRQFEEFVERATATSGNFRSETELFHFPRNNHGSC